MRLCLVAGLFTSALLIAGQSLAQGYPVKPVRMVIPFPPGGSSDAVGRVIAERLGEEWKQPVVIDNRPGAGTTIASAYVAGQPADGYTLYLQGVSTHASAGALYRNITFDPVKSFAPVVNVSQSPFILVVNPAIKANNARELMDLARVKPEALKAGTSGAGGSPHLYTEMLARGTNNKFLHVPYKGMAPAIVAVIAGEVDMLVADVAVMPQVRGGKVRALAVTTPKPSQLVPGVPTMADAGVPGMAMPSYIAIIGPAGMPREVVGSINSQVNRALGNNDVKERLLKQGFEPAGGTPEELGALLASETQRLTQVIREAGIKLE